MAESTPTERRRAPRISHQTEIYFKPGKKSNQQGFVRDLSETGTFLVAFEQMYERSQVILYVPIQIRGRETLCMLQGEVSRTEKKTGVKAFGYGVQFTNLSPGTAAMLKQFLNQKLKEEFPSSDMLVRA